MLLARVIEASAAVAETTSRSAKVLTLATTLVESTAGPDASGHTIEVVADYLAGTVPQRRLGVSWRGLRDVPAPATQAQLTVAQADAALAALASTSGTGAAVRRRKAIRSLFARATEPEQQWLSGLITGELRQGASDGLVQQAIARAAGVDEAIVRGAVMRAGYAGPVARVALCARHPQDAMAALTAMSLQVGRPSRPMLAASSPTIEAAMGQGRAVAVERKLDGVRVQAHLWDEPKGRRVHIFTRTLEEITERVPEVVEVLTSLPTNAAVLDGEIIAVGPDGRPEPFQVTGARTANSTDPERMSQEVPLTIVLFDVLHRGSDDLLDTPAAARWSVLIDLAPELAVPRLVTQDPQAACEFFREQVRQGHEGVVVKSLDAPYAAGRRGEAWVKVKPRYTFDVVVTAVEWGSGRRSGMLSNLHLAARDKLSGDLVMLGKTFKGMTDEMLDWQTERFLELETHRSEQVVHVRPLQVVEVAVDGIQRSRRYPGGVALRFTRVVRYRHDKGAHEIDSVQHIIETCSSSG